MTPQKNEESTIKIVEKMKKITAYKQGGVWMVNVEGYTHTLHYTRQTKEDVRQWLRERQAEHEYEGYELEFE